MRKNIIIRALCMFVGIVFLFPTTAFAAENVGSMDADSVVISANDARIEALMDERAQVLNKIFLNTSTQTQNVLISDLNEIDLALTQLGVSFLTSEEVAEQFPETKNDKQLALSGQTQAAANDLVQPKTDPPTSSVNTWTSQRTTYTVDGVTYNIQRLTAQPCDPDSPLASTGSRTITFSTNWSAGAANVVSSLAKAVLGGVTSNISGATVALTFYDAVKSFISGISTTTEVDVPNITYSWSNVTTAVFAYTRLSTQTDDYQWLSLVSTKTQTEVGYSIPTFNYVNSNGSTVLSPSVIQGTRTIIARPTNYNSTSLIVEAYNTVSGGPMQNCVSYVKISGPESKAVQTISPICPFYPAHCE